MSSGSVVGGGRREVGRSPASRADYRTAARRRRDGSANGGGAVRTASSGATGQRRPRGRGGAAGFPRPAAERAVGRSGKCAGGSCGVRAGKPAHRRAGRRSRGGHRPWTVAGAAFPADDGGVAPPGCHGRDSAATTGQELTPSGRGRDRSPRRERRDRAPRGPLGRPASNGQATESRRRGGRRPRAVAGAGFPADVGGVSPRWHGADSAAATGQELTSAAGAGSARRGGRGATGAAQFASETGIQAPRRPNLGVGAGADRGPLPERDSRRMSMGFSEVAWTRFCGEERTGTDARRRGGQCSPRRERHYRALRGRFGNWLPTTRRPNLDVGEGTDRGRLPERGSRRMSAGLRLRCVTEGMLRRRPDRD